MYMYNYVDMLQVAKNYNYIFTYTLITVDTQCDTV